MREQDQYTSTLLRYIFGKKKMKRILKSYTCKYFLYFKLRRLPPVPQ